MCLKCQYLERRSHRVQKDMKESALLCSGADIDSLVLALHSLTCFDTVYLLIV